MWNRRRTDLLRPHLGEQKITDSDEQAPQPQVQAQRNGEEHISPELYDQYLQMKDAQCEEETTRHASGNER